MKNKYYSSIALLFLTTFYVQRIFATYNKSQRNESTIERLQKLVEETEDIVGKSRGKMLDIDTKLSSNEEILNKVEENQKRWNSLDKNDFRLLNRVFCVPLIQRQHKNSNIQVSRSTIHTSIINQNTNPINAPQGSQRSIGSTANSNNNPMEEKKIFKYVVPRISEEVNELFSQLVLLFYEDTTCTTKNPFFKGIFDYLKKPVQELIKSYIGKFYAINFLDLRPNCPFFKKNQLVIKENVLDYKLDNGAKPWFSIQLFFSDKLEKKGIAIASFEFGRDFSKILYEFVDYVKSKDIKSFIDRGDCLKLMVTKKEDLHYLVLKALYSNSYYEKLSTSFTEKVIGIMEANKNKQEITIVFAQSHSFSECYEPGKEQKTIKNFLWGVTNTTKSVSCPIYIFSIDYGKHIFLWKANFNAMAKKSNFFCHVKNRVLLNIEYKVDNNNLPIMTYKFIAKDPGIEVLGIEMEENTIDREENTIDREEQLEEYFGIYS